MTPEAAKLIRGKFASRAEWRRHVKEANTLPRKPGSAKPFHRINTLVEAVVKSKDDVERAAAHKALMAYESRGHGRILSYGRMV